ncbi:hypothetical protein M406DRAFT_249949 [Cryphonectria parasitica EP155]|uniref:DUF7924 domain-containing protein n=1 Tax=Cryphonectria parasitica (strain ATCC 38755 / EP155) TaxID=660469 RepID=A0A9P4Y7P9_CRYP1|nr:uncharacterized protein M406DRAFT_249949 [Cryphonectria parasitica EP155]KAF3768457.1 hypothetical protein M406DRAFT_249949 [Cryphonectria parasitica EP155]
MDEPSQSTKRRLDTSLETPSLPAAKRVRLSKTNLQQPAPKRPRASFLEDHGSPTDTISEWLESVGSDRERRCRSDSYLHHSSDDPISRDLMRSAPEMAYAWDADDYAIPPTPDPSNRSIAPSDSGSSRLSRALVEDPYYRDQNLAANHVHMRHRDEQLPEHVANIVDYARRNRDLMYPFFVIEFKGNGEDLWVATNQCLGDSASCINIAERLNRQLRESKSSKVKPVNSTAFSIAMNGTEARLYVSWKHNELDYYMQKVKSFLLQDPEHYIEFRKHVKNIIDWGKDQRLKEIRESLDTLLEESRRRASEAAKSRPPPTKDSTSKSKKPKPPPSR